VPVVFTLTPDGYEDIKASIVECRIAMLREARLAMALANLASREVDSLVVETALVIAAKGA
jgi:hypothetical protein